MCGIIGYTGDGDAVPVLLKGLRSLEYRGYDSAGLAVFSQDGIKTVRSAGKIEALCAKPEIKNLTGSTGIAHTRWATHGEPSEKNAHPHASQGGVFSVVHNGIIENYMTLADTLRREGFSFASDTDTETISQLLERNYNGSALLAVQKALPVLEGSYALCILCRDLPDTLLCACKASPLLVGEGDGFCCVASDAGAFPPQVKRIFRLGEGECALVGRERAEFFDGKGNSVPKKPLENVSARDDTGKGGYEYYMEKEIYEQPQALRATIGEHLNGQRVTLGLSAESAQRLCGAEKFFIVGCGSAYHAAVVGKYVFESLLRIPTEACLASEFRYCNPLANERSLVIIISQSGETADTLAALRTAKEKGSQVLSIVNVPGSTIARESETVLLTRAGRETAVATTKAYSTQLASLYLIAVYVAQEKQCAEHSELMRLITELHALPDKVSLALGSAPEMERLAQKYGERRYAYYIGRNLDYASALEASLKLKEISYVHSEAYAAGELKHGTISLIEKGTLTVALCCCERLTKKTVSNIEEVMARGAQVLCVTSQGNEKNVRGSEIVTVPRSHALFMPSLEVILMQLFSFYSAKYRKCDIDKPRNLAKSVTVE